MGRCEIILENHEGYYVGGQALHGYLQCTFSATRNVTGIHITIQGKAKTHWKTGGGPNGSYHHDIQELFSQQIDLLNNNGAVIALHEGVHRYPFTYTLPPDLPSSFKGEHGEIKYKVKVVVQRPGLVFNYSEEIQFPVLTQVDLNSRIELRNSATQISSKNLYCFCGIGDISLQIHIPFSGIAIGQELPININVDTSVDIKAIRCSISKKLLYVATQPVHKTTRKSTTICSDNFTGVDAHSSCELHKTIVVNDPQHCPNFINCHLIDVGYNLKVTAVLPIPHFNLDVKLPVMLGNIPLENQQRLPSYNYKNTLQVPSFNFHN